MSFHQWRRSECPPRGELVTVVFPPHLAFWWWLQKVHALTLILYIELSILRDLRTVWAGWRRFYGLQVSYISAVKLLRGLSLC